jgi:hypothetical protein
VPGRMINESTGSKGHRKVLTSINRDIRRHEESLVELRALQCKLIRVYERSKSADLIDHSTKLINQLQVELNNYKCGVL